MNKLTKLSLAVVIGSLMMPAFASKTEPYTQSGTNAREMLVEQPIHWISVDQIKKELEGKAPINVSFDIDDTVLFSSPCFYYGQQKYSPGKQDYLKIKTSGMKSMQGVIITQFQNKLVQI